MTVSPGYFEVFKIPVKRGRTFTERDDGAAPPVVIINEAMAKQFWKDGDPLNDRLVIGRGVMREFASEPPRQIIGVVADIRDGGLNSDPGPKMFIPQAQVPDAANALNVRLTPIAWVVRTRGEPHALIAPIQEQLRQVDRAAGVRHPDDGRDRVAVDVARSDSTCWLMTVFGAAALLLAAIGIYGLMAYSVVQRTQEIGIRLALGAETAAVRRMVVVQGMRLAIGSRCRRRGGVRPHAIHRQLPVRRQGAGSNGVRRHTAAAHRRGLRRRVGPCPAREPCESGHSPAHELKIRYHLTAPRSREVPMRRVVLTLSIVVSLSAGVLLRADDLVLDRFGDYLESLRAQAGIPGLAAVIVGPSDVMWERGFGQQNIERLVATRSDTPFHANGLTQLLTASLMLRCVEEGRVSLDARIGQLAPGAPEPDATIRQLLSHTSGPPDALVFVPSRTARAAGIGRLVVRGRYRGFVPISDRRASSSGSR